MMMIRSAAVCALLLLASLQSRAQISAADLTGEWREVARRGSSFFQDTVFLSLRVGQEFLRTRQNGFAYRGTYKLANGRIDLSGMQYAIRMKADTLILTYEGDQSSYIRWTPGPPDVSNRSDGTTNRAYATAPTGTVTSLAQLAGKWSVFKRTSATVQESIDYSRLIKSIVIFAEPQADGSQGHILAGNDGPDAPTWRITRLGPDGAITATGRDERTLRILGFAGGELVLEEAPYTYFFKQFKVQ